MIPFSSVIIVERSLDITILAIILRVWIVNCYSEESAKLWLKSLDVIFVFGHLFMCDLILPEWYWNDSKISLNIEAPLKRYFVSEWRYRNRPYDVLEVKDKTLKKLHCKTAKVVRYVIFLRMCFISANIPFKHM